MYVETCIHADGKVYLDMFRDIYVIAQGQMQYFNHMSIRFT